MGRIQRVALEHIHYITICKLDSQREFAARLRDLKPGLHDNLEAWDREGGREVQEGGNKSLSKADSC